MICSRCVEDKSLDAYYKYASGRLFSRCKDCEKKRQRAVPREKKAAIRRRSYRKCSPEVVAYVRQKKSEPCTDCKKTYHFACMDFDHRPGEKKYLNVGRMRGAGVGCREARDR